MLHGVSQIFAPSCLSTGRFLGKLLEPIFFLRKNPIGAHLLPRYWTGFLHFKKSWWTKRWIFIMRVRWRKKKKKEKKREENYDAPGLSPTCWKCIGGLNELALRWARLNYRWIYIRSIAELSLARLRRNKCESGDNSPSPSSLQYNKRESGDNSFCLSSFFRTSFTKIWMKVLWALTGSVEYSHDFV